MLKQIYRQNEYLRMENTVEEISRMKIRITSSPIEKLKKIEDIEINVEEPNILICEGDENTIMRYENIYPSVRIIITDVESLRFGGWKEIPEYVEYILINNILVFEDLKIYRNNRNKIDYIEIENEGRTINNLIDDIISEGRINEENNIGKTVIDYMMIELRYKEILEMLKEGKIEDRIINNSKKSLLSKLSERYPVYFITKNYKELVELINYVIDITSEELINRYDEKNIEEYENLIYSKMIATQNKNLILKIINRINNVEILKNSYLADRILDDKIILGRSNDVVMEIKDGIRNRIRELENNN